MKKLLLGVIIAVIGSIAAPNAGAQVRVNINVNIGDQPRWRAPGYDYVEYYYLPDIHTYYYVPGRQFIYLSNGRWVFSAGLPARYRGYDLYSGHKVVINQPNAYYYYHDHQMKYNGRHDNGLHRGWYKSKKNKGRGRH
jgi:hypothetical protein